MSEEGYIQATEALLHLWRTHYGEEEVRWLMRAHQFSSTADLADFAAHLLRAEHLDPLLKDRAVLRALATLERCDLPRRGSSILREGALAGLGDLGDGLLSLLDSGFLALCGIKNRRTKTLAEERNNRRFLRGEVELPKPLLAFLLSHAPFAPERKPLEVPEENVEPEGAPSTRTFLLDLLHLAGALDRRTLSINKGGAPHRRELQRVVEGLSVFEGEGVPDLAEPHTCAYLHFLITMGATLGVFGLSEERVKTHQKERAFFHLDEGERAREIVKALKANARWLEIEVLDALWQGSDDLLSLRERETPSGLAGARGQVLGDMAELPLSSWCVVDRTLEVLLHLDRGYLPQTFDLAGEEGPTHFLRAFLTLALPWLGWIETGFASVNGEEHEVIRWTPEGLRALSRKTPNAPGPPKPPPFIVQPNMEVTVFLQDAPLGCIERLYGMGERVRLTEQMALFSLHSRQVQKAYGRGLTADEAIDFLASNGRTPLPDSVAFTLRDLERVHRRITLYTGGTLLEHRDPNKVDVLLGTLEHFQKGKPPLRRLGHSEVFLPETESQEVERGLHAEVQVFDYLADGNLCLQHIGDMRFQVLPGGLDLVTSAELPKIATQTSEEGVWEIDPDRAEDHFPEDTCADLVSFFAPRLKGGVSAALELRFRAFFALSARARIKTQASLVFVSSAEIADKLMEVPSISEWIDRRLAPDVLLLEAGGEEIVQKALLDLGLDRER